MKPDGRTVRTTVHTVRAYEYDEARRQEKARTTAAVGWHPVLGSKHSQLLHGRDFLF